jgi:hypothetical protein
MGAMSFSKATRRRRSEAHVNVITQASSITLLNNHPPFKPTA